MLKSQIYELVNVSQSEMTGMLSTVLEEDLGNLNTFGDDIIQNGNAPIFSQKLIDRIGKLQIEAYEYPERAPKLWMDSVEYGSVTQKIEFELVDAIEDESWELQDGVSYDPFVFTEPKVDVTYFNGGTTFRVPVSIQLTMLKQAFTSFEAMDSMVSGIFLYINNSLAMARDNLVMRTLAHMTALTIHENNKNRTRHLLTEYNKAHKTTLTAEEALEDKEAIKFILKQMKLTKSHMGHFCRLYNMKGKRKFTGNSRLHMVMLDVLEIAADLYLESDTFHDEYVKMPHGESVVAWQGIGDDFADLKNVSTINVKTKNGDVVKQSYVLAVMFDQLACCMCNKKATTQTIFNPVGEFTNYWYKQEAQYRIDDGENYVVFLLD